MLKKIYELPNWIKLSTSILLVAISLVSAVIAMEDRYYNLRENL